MQYFML